MVGTSAFAEDDVLNEDFLEFLADLETIDDTWTHPIDFDDTISNDSNITPDKYTATEINNE